MTDRQLTRSEAIAFFKSEAWRDLTPADRARLQMGQELLCMPFREFHAATETLLGRAVWTHEFADTAALRAEADGKTPPRSMADIIALIPAEKLVIVQV